MARAPLTHHDILELAAPFSRCGRHVDLAATDRMERRLAFKPIEHPAAGDPPSALQETLLLEHLATGTFRLTRVVRDATGLEAVLSALGANPAHLLSAFQHIDPRHHFRFADRYRIARSYELHSMPDHRGRAPPQPVFTRGTARGADFTLTLTLPSTRGVAANLELRAPPECDVLDAPEDLLAVLGWDWVQMIRDGEIWKSKLRLRGDAHRRSRGAERALEVAAAHLARTLAEPPCRFHERWAAARWIVVLRRSIPLSMLVVLALLIAVLPHILPHPKPGVQVMLFYIPVVLIALSFCLQEQARYEIPPRPRRSRAAGWQRPRQP
jgi:hypothetical protein